MSTIKDVINARIKAAKNQAPILNVIYAKTIGIDSDSSPAVANRPGFVWVQEKGNNHAFQVYNPSVKLAVDMPVKIVRDTNAPSRRIVQGIDWDSLAVQLTSSSPGQALGVPNHHRDHEWPTMFPGLDAMHTYPRAIVPLKMYPGNVALTISVAPGYYMVDKTSTYYAGLVNDDISSYIPSTVGNHVSVLVFIDSATNLVGYLSGSESALLFPVEPDIPDGNIGLGYIRLVHGMSGLLTETEITNDPRPFISIATGAGGGGGTPATTVTDETTWGITPAVGSDTEYARQDHTHGSPAAPGGSGDVIGNGAVTDGHLAVFDTDVHHIKDGGAVPAVGGNVSDTGATTANHLAIWNGASDHVIKDGGAVPSGDVVGPAGATAGHLAVFDGASGKLVADGGAPSGGGDVHGDGSATPGHIAVFVTDGYHIEDGGVPGSGSTDVLMVQIFS